MFQVKGMLEVDTDRGTIYFHTEDGITFLRIGHLPTPILVDQMIDVVYVKGTVSYGKTNDQAVEGSTGDLHPREAGWTVLRDQEDEGPDNPGPDSAPD